MAIFSFTNIAFSLISLYVARRVYWEATNGTRHRTLAKQKGALPAPERVSNIPFFIPTFGIDIIIEQLRAIKGKRFLDHWQKRLTDANAHTVSSNVLGKHFLLTDDPENVKAILATHFEDWSLGKERIDELSSWLGHGIFTNEGKAWKHSREMLRPCFERSQVADVSVFEKHTAQLMELLPADISTVDLQPLFLEFTLDVATEFLFGQSTDSLGRGAQSQEFKEFVEAFEYRGGNGMETENFKRYGYIGLLFPDKKSKRCTKTIQAFADKLIDEKIASNATNPPFPSRYIFLDELLAATSDRIAIRSELLNILLAGRDTTAALLSNLVWSLSHHPSILSTLRAEISSILGPDATAPTYQNLKDMKYLRAIMNESQRLYPIVPANSRCAVVDTFLPHGTGTSPVLVPAGTYVAYHVYAMHRRRDIYGPDADAFRPERWLEPGFRPGWAYMPFSGGPRVCIGQNFAVTEVGYVVVRLVMAWEVEGRGEEVWREKLSVTCTGDGGCRVGLRRREL